MPTLIAYYSRAGENYEDGALRNLKIGHTEVMARILQQTVGGDLYAILPLHPYAASYVQCIHEAKQDLSRGIRPPLVGRPLDLAQYDCILLGFPNYWNTLPMPVVTFLEAHDFTGKWILPFCTHEGGEFGHSLRDLVQICPGAVIGAGIAVRGGDVTRQEDQIAEWAAKALLSRETRPTRRTI